MWWTMHFDIDADVCSEIETEVVYNDLNDMLTNLIDIQVTDCNLTADCIKLSCDINEFMKHPAKNSVSSLFVRYNDIQDKFVYDEGVYY